MRCRLPAHRPLQELDGCSKLRVSGGPDDHRFDRVLRGVCGSRAARWRAIAARIGVDRTAVLQGAVKVAFEADDGVRDLLIFWHRDNNIRRDPLTLDRSARRRVIKGGGQAERAVSLQWN